MNQKIISRSLALNPSKGEQVLLSDQNNKR